MTMTNRDLIRVCTYTIALALFSTFASPPARAGMTVYVTGIGNEFGTLNLSTGAFNQIATLDLPNGDYIYGMGYGANGMLYGLDALPTASLYQINPATGALVDLGLTGQSVAGATSDASGKLFVISQDIDAIYSTMTPPSTTPSVVGPIGYGSTGLMAVSADGSQLFTTISTGSSSTYDLASINPTTGATSDLGDTGFTVDAGLFVGGTLYGFDTSSNAIVTLNTSTGVGTQVGTYYLPNGDNILSAAVAPSAVPEPSSLIGIVVGIGLAGSFGRFRHR
jgi:hypothetical protein